MQAVARTLVIIPAFDEATQIASVVGDVRAHLPGADVLVVDDGSTDATASIARAAGAIVLRLPFNLGVGAAMQTGFLFACSRDYAFSVQVDGDGQHPAEEISRLLAPILRGEADAVVGSRYLEGTYEASGGRRSGQRFFSWLVSRLTRSSFTDTTSGFRAYRRVAFEYLSQNYSRDYPEVNAIVALCQRGLRIVEVPVAMRSRRGGSSHITWLRAIYYMLKVPLATLMAAARRPRPFLDTHAGR